MEVCPTLKQFQQNIDSIVIEHCSLSLLELENVCQTSKVGAMLIRIILLRLVQAMGKHDYKINESRIHSARDESREVFRDLVRQLSSKKWAFQAHLNLALCLYYLKPESGIFSSALIQNASYFEKPSLTMDEKLLIQYANVFNHHAVHGYTPQEFYDSSEQVVLNNNRYTIRM